MAKSTTKQVRESRARAGYKSTSIFLTDEEKGEIDAFAAEIGVRGRREAILEAVRSYKAQGRISRERLLRELQARLT